MARTNTQTNVTVLSTEQRETPMGQIEQIELFVTAQFPLVELLSNEVINTSGIDDIRLDALREKGIRSFRCAHDVTVTYTDGSTVSFNGALAAAALLAGVTVTNVKESLAQGKFASRSKAIILPTEQINAINAARIEQHNAKVAKEASNLNQYINSAGITYNLIDLPLYWALYTAQAVIGADDAGIWVSYPKDHLDIPGLISLEVIKGRVSYEHRVQLETTSIVA